MATGKRIPSGMKPETKGEAKSRFRTLVAWKRFRDFMIQEVNYTCECCGMRYTPVRRHLLNVHHRDPENYEDLVPEKFRVLCYTCHTYIEFLIKRIDGKSFKNYRNFPVVYMGLRDFLTYATVKKGDDFISRAETFVLQTKITGETK